MSNIYKGAVELIGKTPLVEVVNVEKELGLKARVLDRKSTRLNSSHIL